MSGFQIPKEVSGHDIGARGCHLVPFGHHGFWCGNKEAREYFLGLMQQMDMSWCVLLTDGDSVLQKYDGKSVVEWLLGVGIIPIVRWYAQLPQHFTGMEVVKQLVTIHKRFELKPFMQLWNELADSREWKKGIVPTNWWEIAMDRINHAARIVLDLGGLPGFPDGPGYNFTTNHPFRDTNASLWEDGMWYAVHNYSKGRPLDYPYDDVSRLGTPLTLEEYHDALDDFADDSKWNEKELPLELINYQRELWADENQTTLTDDTCWMAWEKIRYYSKETLGFYVPMAMTEGGWQPRDNAGSTPPNIDVRWPYTTPKMVAKKTLEMFSYKEAMFCQCPWLLGCGSMGGSGWEYDAWTGGAFYDKYGWEKPVIDALKVKDEIQEARVLIRKAIAILTP